MKWHDGLASVILAGMAGAIVGTVLAYTYMIIRDGLRAVGY